MTAPNSGATNQMNVETHDLARASTDIDGIRTQMMSEVNALKAEADAAGAGWKGEASGKFQAAMQHIDQVSQSMLQTLDSMGKQVGDNAKKYTGQDQSFSDLIKMPS